MYPELTYSSKTKKRNQNQINITIMSAAPKKRRTFRKFTFRGVDLEQLTKMDKEELRGLLTARARRRFRRNVS